MSTNFELLYTVTNPFEHPLYQRVHKKISYLENNANLDILDVGGRRSNYTIGLKSLITVSELPKEEEFQYDLDLGATEELIKKVTSRRSNIKSYIFDDMTKTELPEESFDIICAIEVLEHVEQDEIFVKNVMKSLKPNGFFIMTTPNGDHLTKPYPDHKRHYKLSQLYKILSDYFENVNIDYIVNDDWLIKIGVHKPSIKAPIRTFVSLFALFFSYQLERLGYGGDGPEGKRHLFAVCQKTQK